MKFLFAFVLGLWIFINFRSFIEQYKGGLDPREAGIRQRVRKVISRSVEITLIVVLVLHFFAQPLNAPVAAAFVALIAWLTYAAANFYFRRV